MKKKRVSRGLSRRTIPLKRIILLMSSGIACLLVVIGVSVLAVQYTNQPLSDQNVSGNISEQNAKTSKPAKRTSMIVKEVIPTGNKDNLKAYSNKIVQAEPAQSHQNHMLKQEDPDKLQTISVNIITEDGTLTPWKPIVHDGMTEAELAQAEDALQQYEKQLIEFQSQLVERETKDTEPDAPAPVSAPVTERLMEGVNLTRIGAVNDTQVNAVMRGFHTYPTSIQDLIIAKGYRVEVSNEDIEKLITGGGTNSWYGATAGPPLNVVIISIHQTEAEIVRTTIHELGHALDNSLGVVSNSPEFIACYTTEGKTMYKTAYVSSASEWFSECAVYYLLDPAMLKMTAPNSYAYIAKILR